MDDAQTEEPQLEADPRTEGLICLPRGVESGTWCTDSSRRRIWRPAVIPPVVTGLSPGSCATAYQGQPRLDGTQISRLG